MKIASLFLVITLSLICLRPYYLMVSENRNYNESSLFISPKSASSFDENSIHVTQILLKESNRKNMLNFESHNLSLIREINGTLPPKKGDWIINDTTTVKDSILIINGSILVYGSLVLVNSTIYLRMDYPGEHALIVYSNASLIMIKSCITSFDPECRGYIKILDGAKFYMNSSVISHLGVSPSDGQNGLFIRKSSVIMVGSLIYRTSHGVEIMKSKNVVISNCTFLRNTMESLRLHHCANVLIKNTRILITNNGLDIVLSENVTVSHMVVNNTPNYGIVVYRSKSIKIGHSTLTKCREGIYVYYSTDCVIRDNCFISDKYGITFYGNVSVEIYNNSFIGCGIYFFTSPEMDLRIVNNFINGKPIVFLRNAKNKTIRDAGEIILLNSSNINIIGCNLSQATVGLLIFSSVNISISQCVFEWNIWGAKIVNSSMITFSHCIFYKNARVHELFTIATLLISGSHNISILSCDFIEDSISIHITNSEGILISSCKMNKCKYGVYLKKCYQAIIKLNEFLAHSYGLVLDSCVGMSVSNNEFQFCGMFVKGKNEENFDFVVLNNSVNGKSLFYLFKMSNLTIRNAGQVIIAFSDNIIIEDSNLSAASVGVEVVSSHAVSIQYSIISCSMYGIYALKSNSINIAYCELLNNTYGALFKKCRNIELSNLKIINSKDGLEIDESSNISMSHTIIIKSCTGIDAFHTCHLVVYNCVFKNCTTGIECSFSEELLVRSSTFLCRFAGINIREVNLVSIENNIFFKCGILIDAFVGSMVLKDNSVNGKPLMFLCDKEDLKIRLKNVGQLIILRCKNITIEGTQITETTCGIEVVSSSLIFIKNSTLVDNYYGIKVLGRSLIAIIQCCFENNRYGVNIQYGIGMVVMSCVFNGNKYGLHVWSDTINVVNCSICNNTYGLVLFKTIGYVILNNTFTNNAIAIWPYGDCRAGWICDNNIYNNSCGIFCCSRNTMIIGNNIAYNEEGIYIYTYNTTHVILNNFVNNSADVIDPWKNTFHMDGYGNFWSIHKAKDANFDLILDKVFYIDHNSIDAYPLASPIKALFPWFYYSINIIKQNESSLIMIKFIDVKLKLNVNKVAIEYQVGAEKRIAYLKFNNKTNVFETRVSGNITISRILVNYSDKGGPLVLYHYYWPQYITEEDKVVVVACVYDPSGVSEVKIHYQANNEAHENTMKKFCHWIYYGEIPPYPGGTKVCLKIIAMDSQGNTSESSELVYKVRKEKRAEIPKHGLHEIIGVLLIYMMIYLIILIASARFKKKSSEKEGKPTNDESASKLHQITMWASMLGHTAI